eukprot:GFUD01009963.1.p1 GENE.GFUD01009963.1~~GFUD01009963.1.p1  ORF type:complete len:360 (+),score=44.02 GFUD01009963.1:326-1405(+)
MCIFTSDKDIPGHVRLSTRTLQYLIIPLLSAALLVVGVLNINGCAAQPLLPVWHIVAGSTGLIVPLLYLLFDDLNPALAKKCPGLSEALDNVVVFVLPVYILFEIAWLITGTVWVVGVDVNECDKTIHIFSVVVIVNFWIHILTPLLFMLCLCCSRIFPFLGYCTYWNIMKDAIELWTRPVRLGICLIIALPLGVSMVGVGVYSLQSCSNETAEISFKSPNNTSGTNMTATESELDQDMLDVEMHHIPVWLIVAGILVVLVPVFYFIYDAFCKPEDVKQSTKNLSQLLVILFLLAGLAWAVVGFVWIFGAHNIQNTYCGHNSTTYWFAFASLIILNSLMDVWICFKICVILYWALISDE